MRYLRQTISAACFGIFSFSSAQATLLSYDSCTGAVDCFKAPDQFALPNPIVQDPNNGILLGWDERQNITLADDLRVDRVADPGASFVGSDGAGFFIKAGTIVSSHYFQWDPGASSAARVDARIRFDSEIFAFITTDDKLSISDTALGLPGLDYADFSLRGLEASDSTNFAPGGNNALVDVSWSATSPGDWTRLITAFSPTAQAAPTPGSLALMIVGLGALRLRRRSRPQSRISSPVVRK